jgi:hypothetical protein
MIDSSVFTGRLFLAGDAGFEEAVLGRVFNARRPGRRPAAVLQAASEQDVVAGVGLARAQGWKVAIRAGGHSWAAWSVREGGLLIDLGGLKEIVYDEAGPRRRTTVTCCGPPAVRVPGSSVSSSASTCARCRCRERCTKACTSIRPRYTSR